MIKNLSVLQIALGASLGASLVCAFVPTFVSNLHASKLSEALDGLHTLSGSALVLAAGAPPELAFPESAPRTPADVPSGRMVVDAPGTWQHPTWRILGFHMEGPHAYSFSFESGTRPEGAHFVASAFGDLDGDGELSRFSVFGHVEGTGAPVTYPVRIEREIE